MKDSTHVLAPCCSMLSRMPHSAGLPTANTCTVHVGTDLVSYLQKRGCPSVKLQDPVGQSTGGGDVAGRREGVVND